MTVHATWHVLAQLHEQVTSVGPPHVVEGEKLLERGLARPEFSYCLLPLGNPGPHLPGNINT